MGHTATVCSPEDGLGSEGDRDSDAADEGSCTMNPCGCLLVAFFFFFLLFCEKAVSLLKNNMMVRK